MSAKENANNNEMVYRTGLFYPCIEWESGGYVVYTNRYGQYLRRGEIVSMYGTLGFLCKPKGCGALRLAGLPYNSDGQTLLMENHAFFDGIKPRKNVAGFHVVLSSGNNHALFAIQKTDGTEKIFSSRDCIIGAGAGAVSLSFVFSYKIEAVQP